MYLNSIGPCLSLEGSVCGWLGMYCPQGRVYCCVQVTLAMWVDGVQYLGSSDAHLDVEDLFRCRV